MVGEPNNYTSVPEELTGLDADPDSDLHSEPESGPYGPDSAVFDPEDAEDTPSDLELASIELLEDFPEYDEEDLRQMKLVKAMTQDDLIGIYLNQEDFARNILTAEEEFELGALKDSGREVIYLMLARLAEELELPIYIEAAQILTKPASQRNKTEQKRLEKAYQYLVDHHLELLPPTLLEQYNIGIEARNALVRHNIRLVISLTAQYFHKVIDPIDLVQEGNLGLLRAANKFDPQKGFKFSTYATWWIKQKLYRYFYRDHQASIPLHAIDLWNKVKKLQRVMQHELGVVQVPDQLIAERLIAEGAARVDNVTLLTKMLQDTRNAIGALPSLDEELTNAAGDSETERGELIEDPKAYIPGNSLHLDTLDLVKYVDILPARLRQLIKLRYVDGMTLEEIALVLPNENTGEPGTSRERVRQLEKEALRQLREKIDPWDERRRNNQNRYLRENARLNGSKNGNHNQES